MIRLLCDCGCLVEREDAGEQTVFCPACGRPMLVPTHGEHFPAVRFPTRGRYTDEPPVDVPLDQRFEPRFTGTPTTSAKAVACLVLGIASLGLTWIAAIPALIIGYRAHRDITGSMGRLKGLGFAWWGIILGWVGIVLLPVGLGIVAVREVREAAARMQASNNMHQFGLAMHNYHDTYDCFPTAYTMVDAADGKSRKPGVSWRVDIFPYVEASNVYSRFNHEEAWDAPSNWPLAQLALKVYQFPEDKSAAPNETYYQVFVTSESSKLRSMFNDQKHFGEKVSFGQMQHPNSEVILIGEGTTPVPWSSPRDMAFDSTALTPPMGHHFRAGSLAGMVDGSVRLIPLDTDPEALKRMISRDLLPDEVGDVDW